MTVCHPHETPDFKQIVDKIIAFFAIYTGAVLSFFVKDFLFSDFNMKNFHTIGNWLNFWGFWITLAVIALLLRYIVGSATHLNHTYIASNTLTIENNEIKSAIDPATYRSKDLCWLFLDLLFIIYFGIIAVFITRSTDHLSVLMLHSVYFIAGGFVWSLLALLRTKERGIGIVWMIVDGIQILVTLFIIFYSSFSELSQAIILGISYLVFLFIDLYWMVRWAS